MDLPKMYELAHNLRIDIERLSIDINNKSLKYRELCAAIEKEKQNLKDKEPKNGCK